MECARPDPPEEFVELVRDALLHLYDRSYLQTHPLAALAGSGGSSATGGQRLRRAILDAIDALQPEPGTDATSRAWRVVHILELRYIEGLDVGTVMDRVALGKSQYHREHHRALLALASLLWERWDLDHRWADFAAEMARPHARAELTRHEVRAVVPAAGIGPIDPVEVAHGVGRLIEPLCASLGVALHLDLPAHLPSIRGERVTLRQALMAILAHAVEAAGGGRVELSGRQDGQQIELAVRLEAVRTPQPLPRGLAESRPFVEALHGQIRAPAPAAGAPWSACLRFPAGQERTLLVVDNNSDFVHLVRRYLVGQGWEVVGATDVDQAAAWVDQQPPRAILLDIVLPGHDGWELLLELKRRPATRDIPVLVCSVLDEPAVARSLGAAGYLQKPVDRLRLLAALAPLG